MIRSSHSVVGANTMWPPDSMARGQPRLVGPFFESDLDRDYLVLQPRAPPAGLCGAAGGWVEVGAVWRCRRPVAEFRRACLRCLGSVSNG